MKHVLHLIAMMIVFMVVLGAMWNTAQNLLTR